MEPKKNPKYDVHRQRGTIFQISLAITLALIITAFKWKVPVEKVPVPDRLTLLPSTMHEDIILSTSIKNDVAPVAREIKIQKQKPVEFVPVEDKPLESDDSTKPSIDQGEAPENIFSSGLIELTPEVPSDSVFIIVEKMPEPVGGYQGFYNGLSRNLKYPRRATRNNVTGKVFISFVVNEKSELSDFKVVKGIGNDCDEEAIRVIALSKWNAGKQRGRPVKVRMVQTINFQLN